MNSFLLQERKCYFNFTFINSPCLGGVGKHVLLRGLGFLFLKGPSRNRCSAQRAKTGFIFQGGHGRGLDRIISIKWKKLITSITTPVKSLVVTCCCVYKRLFQQAEQLILYKYLSCGELLENKYISMRWPLEGWGGRHGRLLQHPGIQGRAWLGSDRS